MPVDMIAEIDDEENERTLFRRGAKGTEKSGEQSEILDSKAWATRDIEIHAVGRATGQLKMKIGYMEKEPMHHASGQLKKGPNLK